MVALMWSRGPRTPQPALLLPPCAEAVPYLVHGLQNVDVFAGEVATFSCEVSRAGGPEARWWLDGTLLQDGPQSAICVRNGTLHSLTLSGLGVADSGTITYRAGPLVSTAKLLVKGTSQWDPARTDASAPAAPARFLWTPGKGDWGLASLHVCHGWAYGQAAVLHG